MKVLQLFLLMMILSVSLFSKSLYEREVRDFLNQLKEEKKVTKTKEKMLSCKDIATNPLEINELVNGENLENSDKCLEDKE